MQEGTAKQVFVKKQGDICTVYTNSPVEFGKAIPHALTIPIVAHNSKPVGYPQTFVTPARCQRAFPDCELVFLEKPSSGKQSVVQPLDAADSKKVQDILGGKAVQQQPVVKRVAPTTAPPPPGEAKDSYCSCDKIHIALQKLQLAKQYASKKNQKILDIKIETIKELLDE